MDIVCNGIRFGMLGTIQFNDQLCFIAVKVGNLVSEDLLAAEAGRTVTQKVKPEVAFFFCHVFAQRFGAGNKTFVSGIIHAAVSLYTPQSRCSRASSPQGEPLVRFSYGRGGWR